MKIRYILLILTITLCIIGCSTTAPKQIVKSDKPSLSDEFWKKDVKKEKLSKKSWTETELHDNLPVYIKDILDKHGIVPWGYYTIVKSNSIFYEVVYIKKHLLTPDSEVVNYHVAGLTYRSGRLGINIDITNLDSEAQIQAEAIFSPITGTFRQLKIKKDEYEWVTVYNLKEQIKT